MIRIIVWVLIAALGTFPAFKLFRYYKKTKIIDYLLLALAFVIAIFEVFVILILESGRETLIVYQVNDLLYPTFILMFIIHGIRMRWDKSPLVLTAGIGVWYFVMIISIFLYKMQTLPATGSMFFIKTKNTALISYGPLFKINGEIIMGRGFELLAHLFRVFAILLVLFAYLRTEDLARLIQVRIARRVFLISIVSAGIFPMVLIGEALQWWSIAESIEWHIFDLATFFGVAYISVRYPQTLLISKTQILRTLEVIDVLQVNVPRGHLGIHEIEEYLMLIDRTVSDMILKKSS